MGLALLLAFLTALDFGFSQGLWCRHFIDLNDLTLFCRSNRVGFVTQRQSINFSKLQLIAKRKDLEDCASLAGKK